MLLGVFYHVGGVRALQSRYQAGFSLLILDEVIIKLVRELKFDTIQFLQKNTPIALTQLIPSLLKLFLVIAYHDSCQ